MEDTSRGPTTTSGPNLGPNICSPDRRVNFRGEDRVSKLPATPLKLTETLPYALRVITDERDEVMGTLEVAQTQVELAEEENDQLVEDIERIGSAIQSAPDLDDTIKTQFMGLRETVTSFTQAFCNHQIIASSLPNNVRSMFATISENSATLLLTSKVHARYFIEGLIWRILFSTLLMNPFCIWGETMEFSSLIDGVLRKCWAKYSFFGWNLAAS